MSGVRARAVALVLLIAAPAVAQTTVSVSTDTPAAPHRRYKIGDTDQPRAEGWLQRIENTLPVALLVFLGLRGHVQISGSSGK